MNELGYRDLIVAALREDRADLDVTSLAVIPPGARGTARIFAKEEGVLAGLPVAAEVFAAIDEESEFTPILTDGARLRPGAGIAEVRGRLRAILAGERVALNFLQRLSGIATATATLVERVKDYPVKILDTRKTTPGLRALEKYAVRVGGGANHRFSLADMILIKDNHIAAAGGITRAVERVRARNHAGLPVEVEVKTLAELDEALALEPPVDRILLDNMDLATLAEAVRRTAGRIPLEASGGVNLEKVRAIAETGVDYISVGALTHSVRALDISLELEPWAPLRGWE